MQQYNVGVPLKMIAADTADTFPETPAGGFITSTVFQLNFNSLHSLYVLFFSFLALLAVVSTGPL